jgi:hypothetical protein
MREDRRGCTKSSALFTMKKEYVTTTIKSKQHFHINCGMKQEICGLYLPNQRPEKTTRFIFLIGVSRKFS